MRWCYNCCHPLCPDSGKDDFVDQCPYFPHGKGEDACPSAEDAVIYPSESDALDDDDSEGGAS